MAEYDHPGVYVSDIDDGPYVIQAASTSTACFIGETVMGRPFAPTLVTSFMEFNRLFGGLERRAGSHQRDMPLAAQQFFLNGGSQLYVVRVIDVDAAKATGAIGKNITVDAAGQGAWGNNITVTLSANITSTARFDVSVTLTRQDGSTSVVETFADLGLDPSKPKFYATLLNKNSNYIRIARDAKNAFFESTDKDISKTLGFSPPPKGQSGQPSVSVTLKGGNDGKANAPAISNASLTAATDKLLRFKDISILAVPGVFDDTLLTDVIAWVENQTSMIMILDSPGDPHNLSDGPTQLTKVKAYQQKVTNNDFAALYFPWLEVPDPYTQVTGATRFAPPSGFIAGLYARTDQTRGVWKAPVGTEATIEGAVGLAMDVTDTDQDTLNPFGINALRKFDAAGIVCWGARTQGEPGSEYMYVPVRRTAIFLRKSLFTGTQWVVFEPNDAPLWRSITDNVTAFMTLQFRAGAFQGASPSESFFVICNDTNNIQASIDAGQVHVLVGFAPLKPAEFVIIELTQIHHEP